jgi:hypothetical protein
MGSTESGVLGERTGDYRAAKEKSVKDFVLGEFAMDEAI